MLAQSKPAVVTVLDWILNHHFIAIRSRVQEDDAGAWDALNSDDMRDFDKRVYRAFVLAFTSTAQRFTDSPEQQADELYKAMEWAMGSEYDCLARGALQRQARAARKTRQCKRTDAGMLTHKSQSHCTTRQSAGARATNKALAAYLQTLSIIE